MLTYRPDIDGLRALAVILVLFFHAGLPFITGGFIGVDIFFVISGYLITSIIYSELNRDCFSFSRFYERRVRRILPALYLMAVVTMSVSLFVLTPKDLVSASSAMLAAVFFSSNIYFWRTTNYFSDSSDYQPFLHTWSLGVEEQFYFLFPLALVFLFKRKKLLISMVVLAFLGSLTISIYATYNYAWAGYYLLPSRAWQMMAGAILAIYPIKQIHNPKINTLLSLVCLLCLIIPAFALNKSTPFPGIAAIPPTLGAVLLIYLGSKKELFISKLFSLKPMVRIGLMSYSLYLWHWPVFAFLRYYKAETVLTLTESVAGIIVSFVLAYLSWKYVEGLFRNKSRLPRKSVYLSVGLGTCVLALITTFILLKSGLPSRLDNKVIEYAAINGDHILADECIHKSPTQIRQGSVCKLSNSEAHETVLLWGDSHAASLKPGFELALGITQRSGVFIGGVGCPPIPNILKVNFGSGDECVKSNSATLQFVLDSPNLKTIVLHARWALSIEGSRYGSEGGKPYVLKNLDSNVSAASRDNIVAVTMGMESLLEQLVLANKTIIIIGPVPEVGTNVPRVMSSIIQWGKDRDIRPTTEEFKQRQARVLSLLARFGEEYEQVKVIFPHEQLCGEEFCEILDDKGQLLYLDDDHLSEDGAKLVGQQLADALRY